MQTVRDEAGRTYLLRKRSAEASLVYDPKTGEERYVPNAELEATGEGPLTVAASVVPEGGRRLFRAVHSDATLGFLVVLDARGPLAVRDLLATTGLCERDLGGLCTELRAAGVIAETDVAGERGYRVTDATSEALERVLGRHGTES